MRSRLIVKAENLLLPLQEIFKKLTNPSSFIFAGRSDHVLPLYANSKSGVELCVGLDTMYAVDYK